MATTIATIPAPNYPDPELSYAVNTAGGYGPYGGYSGYSWSNGAWGSSGIAAGYPKGADKPGKPALMGCGGADFIPEGGVILSRAIDDVIANLGADVYDLMAQDDCVSAALGMLAYAVMGGDITVEPAILPEPGERIDETTDPNRKKDIDDAKLYADEFRRSIDRVPNIADELEAILTEGLIFGAALGDPAWEVVKGPADDKPVTLLKSLQCRGRRSWAMVVDQYGQFSQVAGYSWEGPRIYDRNRFLVFVNSPRRGDPRGTSDLRPAYEPWNFKTQARPERGKYIATYANPTVVLEYDPSMQPTFPVDPATGQEDTTQALLTPQAQAERVAANVHGNSWMALPIPWKAALIESKNDGGAFATHEEDCNKAILQAILLTSRTLNEAEHGSKADSDVATNATMIKVGRKEQSFARAIERGLCWVQTMMNHGEDAANRLCPRIKFPDTNAGTKADLITAFTGAGWKTTPRQAAHIDARFGLPVRSADEIDEQKAQSDAMQQASIEATKAKAAGPGGDPGAADDAANSPVGKAGPGKPTDKPNGKATARADGKSLTTDDVKARGKAPAKSTSKTEGK